MSRKFWIVIEREEKVFGGQNSMSCHEAKSFLFKERQVLRIELNRHYCLNIVKFMIEPSDKAILISLYVSALEPEISPLEFLMNRTTLSEEMFSSKLKEMIKNGFVENSDPPRLTFIGRGLLKVVLIGGVFDIVHPGHIHTLRDAKSQGDVLVVVVARSSTALRINKHRKIYHDENLRKELVSSIRYVDYAIIGREGTLYDTVEFVKPDIIALGYDQIHTEKEIAVNCAKRGINTRIIRLNTPIPGSKSTQIKEELGQSIYDI
jgi:cytidyltransferase-like protein